MKIKWQKTVLANFISCGHKHQLKQFFYLKCICYFCKEKWLNKSCCCRCCTKHFALLKMLSSVHLRLLFCPSQYWQLRIDNNVHRANAKWFSWLHVSWGRFSHVQLSWLSVVYTYQLQCKAVLLVNTMEVHVNMRETDTATDWQITFKDGSIQGNKTPETGRLNCLHAVLAQLVFRIVSFQISTRRYSNCVKKVALHFIFTFMLSYFKSVLL